MSTEQDRFLLSWPEVAAVWNYRENKTDSVDAVKNCGLAAMRKLKEKFAEDGINIEDLVDV